MVTGLKSRLGQDDIVSMNFRLVAPKGVTHRYAVVAGDVLIGRVESRQSGWHTWDAQGNLLGTTSDSKKSAANLLKF